MFKGWSIFSVSVALLVCSYTKGFELISTLSPLQIVPGERFVLEIRLKNISLDPRPVLQDELLVKESGLIILERNDFEDKGDIVLRYTMTQYKLGEAVVPPVLIRSGPETQSTERQTIQVSTTRSEEDQEIREEFGEVGIPFEWERILRFFVIAVVSFGFFYFLKEWIARIQWRKLVERNYTFGWMKFKPNRKRWAKEQLRVFRLRLASSENLKFIMDDWSLFCRHWLSYKMNQPALCWTQKEIREFVAPFPKMAFYASAMRDEPLRFAPQMKRDRSATEEMINEVERGIHVGMA